MLLFTLTALLCSASQSADKQRADLRAPIAEMLHDSHAVQAAAERQSETPPVQTPPSEIRTAPRMPAAARQSDLEMQRPWPAVRPPVIEHNQPGQESCCRLFRRACLPIATFAGIFGIYAWSWSDNNIYPESFHIDLGKAMKSQFRDDDTQWHACRDIYRVFDKQNVRGSHRGPEFMRPPYVERIPDSIKIKGDRRDTTLGGEKCLWQSTRGTCTFQLTQVHSLEVDVRSKNFEQNWLSFWISPQEATWFGPNSDVKTKWYGRKVPAAEIDLYEAMWPEDFSSKWRFPPSTQFAGADKGADLPEELRNAAHLTMTVRLDAPTPYIQVVACAHGSVHCDVDENNPNKRFPKYWIPPPVLDALNAGRFQHAFVADIWGSKTSSEYGTPEIEASNLRMVMNTGTVHNFLRTCPLAHREGCPPMCRAIKGYSRARLARTMVRLDFPFACKYDLYGNEATEEEIDAIKLDDKTTCGEKKRWVEWDSQHMNPPLTTEQLLNNVLRRQPECAICMTE